jgi:serine/threonine protein phosphatase PrpC
MPSSPIHPTTPTLEYEFEQAGKVPDLYQDEDEEDEPTTGGGAVVRKIRHEDDAQADEPTGVHALFDLRSGGRTDVGAKARANEDALLLLEGESLFVVADGMGGHVGGEVASQLAIEAIASTFVDHGTAPLLLSNVPPRAVKLVQGFAAANEAIRSTASKSQRLSQMGTTVVAARFCPKKGRVYIGHVGDSRCYRLRSGVLEQITQDHTMAEYGVLGKDARRLSRAVGSNGIVEADLVVLAPRAGDVFLLCSDGLTKTLSEPMIVEILLREPDPESAAQELIRVANQLRARDNVTAVVVRVTEKVQPSKGRSP